MAHGKWYGCLLKAVCLFAMIDSLQSNQPPRRIEKRQEHRLEGPEDSFNLIGTNASFICVSPLRSCLNMTWYIEDFWSWTLSGFTKITDLDASVTARIIVQNIPSGCKLTLMNVQWDDNGKIYCEIYSEGSSIRGKEAKLRVTGESYALRGLSDNSSVVGYDVIFNCISPLRYCIGISWYKYTQEGDRAVIFSAEEGNFLRDKYLLENTTLGCRLIIRRVELTDNGRYICKIVISQRPIERSANLIVFEPLNGPENLISFLGTNTTFRCASPFRSCVDMTWYKKYNTFFGTDFFQLRTYRSASRYRRVVKNTTVGCELTIRNVQPNDTGSYKCKLMIGNREFESSIATNLKVIAQEDALRGLNNYSGSNGLWTVLTCLSPLGDCRGMSWYKETPGTGRFAVFSEENGIYLRDKYFVENSTHGCHLTIKHLNNLDTGFIHCQIQISGRPFEKSATILITGGRQNHPLNGPDDSSNFIGTTAVFTCKTRVAACYHLNWYRYTPAPHTRSELIVIRRPVRYRDKYALEQTVLGCNLIIRNVQLNETGYLTCEYVVKGVPYRGKIAHLTVMGRPTPPPTEQENAFLELSDNFTTPGNNASFTCVSRLKNCIGINWYTGSSRNDRRTIFRDQKVLFDKYIVKNSTSGCELFIKRVEYEDRGVMFCERVTSQRSYEVAATLHVFETKSEKVEARFDWQSAFFTCDSPLRSCANMTWYKALPPPLWRIFVPINASDSPVRGRWTVQNSSSGCKLKVIDVQLNDTGDVYCEIMLGGRPIRGERTTLFVSGDEKK